jgi:hypothetical protein
VALDARNGRPVVRPDRSTLVNTATAAPPPASIETLALPIDGLSEAEVRIGFGGGELTIHQAEPGMLISGTFEEGVTLREYGPGRIRLEPRDPARPLVTWAPVHWNFGITGEIPVDLRLDTGANRAVVDLAALRVRRLELHTGASETVLRMPTAGQTAARIECGFASVTVEVPAGVAARISGSVGIGALEVDHRRFPRLDGGWSTPGFETAADRIDISVSGGFGTVKVI